MFKISDTIEIALDLHPKTERIIVVNDTTLTGKNNKKNLEDIMCNFTDIVTFEVWDNVNMSSLQEQVTNLNHNDIILFLLSIRTNHITISLMKKVFE